MDPAAGLVGHLDLDIIAPIPKTPDATTNKAPFDGPRPLTSAEEQILSQFFLDLRNCNLSRASMSSAASSSSSSGRPWSLSDPEIRDIFGPGGLPNVNVTDEQWRRILGEINQRVATAHERAQEIQARTKLNPLAQAFVPTPPPPQTTVIQQFNIITSEFDIKNMPIWHTWFLNGISKRSEMEQNRQAMGLVNCPRHKWLEDCKAIPELAQHFCWKTLKADKEEAPGMAPFAVAVYRQFNASFGEGIGRMFLEELRDRAMKGFCWYWQVSPNNPRAICYRLGPSKGHILSGFAIASFVGDLYIADLLPSNYVLVALRILLREIASLEHIQAIHALLLHTGPKFWYTNHNVEQGQMASLEMCDDLIGQFVTMLQWSVGRLEGNGGSLIKLVKVPDEIDEWIREVVELVNGFKIHRLSNGQERR